MSEEKIERRLPLARQGHRWQRRQEHLAVAAAGQARIADGDGAEILFAADEAADPLLQRQGRFGQLILTESAPSGRLEMLDPCAHQRVIRRGEGQLLDDHQPQRAPLDIHALPEARRAEQHGAAVLAELSEKLLARRLPLHQQAKALVPRTLLPPERGCGRERTMARKEDERAAPGCLDELHRHLHYRRQELRRRRQRHARREIKETLAWIVERTVDLERCAAIETQPAGEGTEVLAERQCRRGEDPGTGVGLDQGLEACRDVERQEAQREAGWPHCRDLERARSLDLADGGDALETLCQLTR